MLSIMCPIGIHAAHASFALSSLTQRKSMEQCQLLLQERDDALQEAPPVKHPLDVGEARLREREDQQLQLLIMQQRLDTMTAALKRKSQEVEDLQQTVCLPWAFMAVWPGGDVGPLLLVYTCCESLRSTAPAVRLQGRTLKPCGAQEMRSKEK